MQVKDATSAVANVDDYSGSARLLAATTLRNVLGTRNLGDILSERESIAQEMQVKIFVIAFKGIASRDFYPVVYRLKTPLRVRTVVDLSKLF